jgi:hypothetical protein
MAKGRKPADDIQHTLYIPGELWQVMRRIAFHDERTISDVARELLVLGLEKRQEEKQRGRSAAGDPDRRESGPDPVDRGAGVQG